MKKIHHWLLVLGLGYSLTLAAQNPGPFASLPYQAVARDAQGQVLVAQALYLTVQLQGATGTPYLVEKHEVVTNSNGYFRIEIGQGVSQQGQLAAVPWAQEQIYLEVGLATAASGPEIGRLRRELLAVPQAFFAQTATELTSAAAPAAEKNTSIFWLTTGNDRIDPINHFFGNRDSTDLRVLTNNDTSLTIMANGRVVVYPRNNAGPDSDRNNYPMLIDGNHYSQGVWISLATERNGDTNFMTFADRDGIKGRIEGETLTELEASEPYRVALDGFEARGVAFGAKIAATLLIASGYAAGSAAAAAAVLATLGASAPAIFGLAAASVAKGGHVVAYTTEFAKMLVEKDNFIDQTKNSVGVSFASGAGDYAEWLERANPLETFSPGDIVGVTGGKVSHRTDPAGHLLVVSHKPIVLGNMPTPGQEGRFEKIAFLGQVRVKIAGPVRCGDYILPSGNHDGVGVAKSPSAMTAADYPRIVGVAWADAPDRPGQLVNVAIGLHRQAVAPAVEQLETGIAQVLAYLDGTAASPRTFAANGANASTLQPSSSPGLNLPEGAAWDQWVENNAGEIRTVMKLAQAQLNAQGFDWEAFPVIKSWYAEPIAWLQRVR